VRFKTLLICYGSGAKRARHAAASGKPREAGSAQSKIARRARNVKNFHCLIYHGIVVNLELQIFHLLLICNSSESKSC
jgi:hypothetical protein